MTASTKFLTPGGGGVILQPASSIAADVAINLPVTGVNGGTIVSTDASGNVGIGTSSPAYKLDIKNGAIAVSNLGDGFLARGTIFGHNTDASNGGIGFTTLSGGSQVERARIDSSGNLLVGTTDPGSTSGVGFKVLHSATIPGCYTIMNTAAGGNSFHLYNTNATNNGFRFYVGVNGGIVNYSGNNVNLSDQRMKTDIEAAGDYLQKICAIPVRTFRYKDQGDTDTEKTLGVIAQEVEAIAPELVNNDGFGITPDDGVPLKTIYQTDLQYALMKCIQEQQAMIQTLQAEVADLKSKVQA